MCGIRVHVHVGCACALYVCIIYGVYICMCGMCVHVHVEHACACVVYVCYIHGVCTGTCGIRVHVHVGCVCACVVCVYACLYVCMHVQRPVRFAPDREKHDILSGEKGTKGILPLVSPLPQSPDPSLQTSQASAQLKGCISRVTSPIERAYTSDTYTSRPTLSLMLQKFTECFGLRLGCAHSVEEI